MNNESQKAQLKELVKAIAKKYTELYVREHLQRNQEDEGFQEQSKSERLDKENSGGSLNFSFDTDQRLSEESKQQIRAKWLEGLRDLSLFGLDSNNDEYKDLSSGKIEFFQEEAYMLLLRSDGFYRIASTSIIETFMDKLTELTPIEESVTPEGRNELIEEAKKRVTSIFTQFKGVLTGVTTTLALDEIRKPMTIYTRKKLLGLFALKMLKERAFSTNIINGISSENESIRDIIYESEQELDKICKKYRITQGELISDHKQHVAIDILLNAVCEHKTVTFEEAVKGIHNYIKMLSVIKKNDNKDLNVLYTLQETRLVMNFIERKKKTNKREQDYWEL